MKIESNVVVPKPVLESVTITLSPRESALLMFLIGNMSNSEVVDKINRNNYIDKDNTDSPSKGIDSKILGLTSNCEVNESVMPIYSKLRNILRGSRVA